MAEAWDEQQLTAWSGGGLAGIEGSANTKPGPPDIESHPGQGGVDAWCNELEAWLAPQRQAPADVRRLLTERRCDGGEIGRAHV